jgi:hypothetical protein
MTEGILEFAIATSILDLEEFCNSDHRAILPNIDMAAANVAIFVAPMAVVSLTTKKE